MFRFASAYFLLFLAGGAFTTSLATDFQFYQVLTRRVFNWFGILQITTVAVLFFPSAKAWFEDRGDDT